MDISVIGASYLSQFKNPLLFFFSNQPGNELWAFGPCQTMLLKCFSAGAKSFRQSPYCAKLRFAEGLAKAMPLNALPVPKSKGIAAIPKAFLRVKIFCF